MNSIRSPVVIGKLPEIVEGDPGPEPEMEIKIENNLMRDYLLGSLPESKASLLEQEIFADDETFERVWEVENMLVDSYVRGTLSPEDRERFERHYLASSVHRRRVKVAEQLIRKADGVRAETGELALQASRPSKLPGNLGIHRSLRRFALAAAVLLLVAGTIWILLERRRLHSELARLAAESETQLTQERQLADQLADARVQSEKLATDLERLRAEQHTLAQRSTAQTQELSSPPKVFGFLLSQVQTRSGQDQQVLTIPPGTDVVHLRMSVETDDTSLYQVGLRTVESRRIVWKQQTIKPMIDDSKHTIITAQIPSGKLARGDYILTLSAVGSAGKPEVVKRYFFRVVR